MVSTRMTAVTQDEFGGPEVLHLAEVPRPEPTLTEVLVRVDAAGVNPADWKTRSGRGTAALWGPPPFTLGWDAAGVVEAVGPGVTTLREGDRVFGMAWFPRQAGAYAEYVTAPSRHFARTPEGLSQVEAGGLALAGLTAWQTLVDTAQVAAGQRVLVHAAAGGVGHLAVQIAAARGARVVGTASAGKHEFVRSLGAAEVVDYRAARFEDVAEPVDVVLDLVGPENALRSLTALRPGGILVTDPGIATPEVRARADELGVRVAGFLVEPDRAGLTALADLVTAGKLRVHVDTVLPLAEAGKAHELGETGRTTGKIVLGVRD